MCSKSESEQHNIICFTWNKSSHWPYICSSRLAMQPPLQQAFFWTPTSSQIMKLRLIISYDCSALSYSYPTNSYNVIVPVFRPCLGEFRLSFILHFYFSASSAPGWLATAWLDGLRHLTLFLLHSLFSVSPELRFFLILILSS